MISTQPLKDRDLPVASRFFADSPLLTGAEAEPAS